jgi:hypothetical protein
VGGDEFTMDPVTLKNIVLESELSFAVLLPFFPITFIHSSISPFIYTIAIFSVFLEFA